MVSSVKQNLRPERIGVSLINSNAYEYTISGKSSMTAFSSYHPSNSALVDMIQVAVQEAHKELSDQKSKDRHLPGPYLGAEASNCSRISEVLIRELKEPLAMKDYSIEKIHLPHYYYLRKPRPKHHDFLVLQNNSRPQEQWILDANYKQFLKLDQVPEVVRNSMPDTMLIQVKDLRSLYQLLNRHEIPQRFWETWANHFLEGYSVNDLPDFSLARKKTNRYEV